MGTQIRMILRITHQLPLSHAVHAFVTSFQRLFTLQLIAFESCDYDPEQ